MNQREPWSVFALDDLSGLTGPLCTPRMGTVTSSSLCPQCLPHSSHSVSVFRMNEWTRGGVCFGSVDVCSALFAAFLTWDNIPPRRERVPERGRTPVSSWNSPQSDGEAQSHPVEEAALVLLVSMLKPLSVQESSALH